MMENVGCLRSQNNSQRCGQGIVQHNIKGRLVKRRGAGLLLIAVLAAMWASWSAYRLRLTTDLPGYDPQSEVGFFHSEAATHYRYYRLVADPATSWREIAATLSHDPAIQYPEGVAVLRDFPVGMEIFYGVLRRWFAPATPPHVFLVHAMSVYAGFLLVMVFLLARRLTGSPWWALLAAAFYATLAWSFERSVWGGFLYEDFALPFLLAALALMLPPRENASYHWPVWRGLAAGATAGCAASFWHVSQYPLALLAALLSLRRACAEAEAKESRFVAGVIAGFGAVALLSPVLRAKWFILSLPIATFCHWWLWTSRWRPGGRWRWARMSAWVATLVGLILLFLVANPHTGDYGHVMEYVMARLRYPLGPPAEPTAMSFVARTMWEPSALAAGRDDIVLGLRFGLVLAPLLLVPILLRRSRGTPLATFCLMALGVLAGGLAMWRFLTLAAPLVATGAVAGLALVHEDLCRARVGGWRLHLARALPWAAVLIVAANGVTLPKRVRGEMGVGRALYGDLVAWMRTHTRPDEAFFARLAVAGTIQLDADRPCLVHSIYESKASREKWEILATAAFADEETFWRRLREFRAAYFICDLAFALKEGAGSPRYEAAKVGPLRLEWAVARCHFAPQELRWFDLVWQCKQFRVYRVRETPASEDDETRRRRIAMIADNAYSPFFDARNFNHTDNTFTDTAASERRIRASLLMVHEAKQALQRHERENARRILGAALRLCLHNLEAYGLLAQLAERSGKREEAAYHLASARAIAPLNQDFAAAAALSALARGRQAEAEGILAEFSLDEAFSPALLRLMGAAALDARDGQRALAVARRWAEVEPGSHLVLGLSGRAHLLLGDKVKGRADLEAYLRGPVPDAERAYVRSLLESAMPTTP